MTLSSVAASRHWQIARPDPAGSGTGCPPRFRDQIVALALEEPELSPREVGGALHRRAALLRLGGDRLPPAQGPGPDHQPAYIVIKAANEFRDKTTAPNQLWQTDFTYLKVIGWGWYYLSTVLDDFSRFIVRGVCATMQVGDVTATLDLALAAAGLDHVQVAHRPRLLSDNGSSYVAGDLADWLGSRGMTHIRGAPPPSSNAGQDRALAPDAQEPHPARTRLPARRTGGAGCRLRRALNHARALESLATSFPRRLLRPRRGHPAGAARIKRPDPSIAACATTRRLPNFSPRRTRASVLSASSRLKSSDDGQPVALTAAIRARDGYRPDLDAMQLPWRPASPRGTRPAENANLRARVTSQPA